MAQKLDFAYVLVKMVPYHQTSQSSGTDVSRIAPQLTVYFKLNMSDNLTVLMINKMKVPELQAELTKRHLDTKGIKQVLVNRLLSSLEILEPKAVNDSNDDEQQNKAEGNMELAQDEELTDDEDDCKDDETS